MTQRCPATGGRGDDVRQLLIIVRISRTASRVSARYVGNINLPSDLGDSSR
jgi:hypothetical protein